jgi:hypothetical protein
MATIPTGNFGNSVASAGPGLQAPGPSQIGSAIERVGQGLLQDQAQTAMARQRAAAATTLAKIDNDLNDAHDEVARGVLDGSIGADKANGEFEKRRQKIQSSSMSGWTPDQQAEMGAHLTKLTGRLSSSLGGVVEKRNQQDTAGFIDQYGEQQLREAMRTGPEAAVGRYASMVQFTGGAAGWNPQQQAERVQRFKESAHFSFYDSAGTAALTKGSVEDLRTVRTKVEADEALDPHRRSLLTRQLFGYEQSLLARQERAKNADDDSARIRFNQAVDIYNKGTDIALGGGYFAPDFIKRMTEASAGTEMEGPVNELIGSQTKVAGFATRPAPERAAILNQYRAERATPGVGVTPTGDALLKSMTEMDDRLRRAADENPWKAAQQAGRIQDAPIINPGDPAQAVQILQHRMGQIGAVEQWTGKRASPFQPEEIDAIGKMVRSLPVDQAASMLASFGGAMGNSERVALASKQLHDKDGTLGLAMSYASAQTTEGRYTAELVLRGSQALKDGTLKEDGLVPATWKGAIAKQIRGAYSNREVEDNAIRAAFLIAGATNGDVDRAINLATGGIIERNGGKLPLPYGMKEPEFEKRLEALDVSSFTSQAPTGKVRAGPALITLDQFVASLQDARLMHAGQGQYWVRAGNTLVTNEAGQRLVIQVTP